MRHELTVHTTLTATHSLSEREHPHPHVWRIQVCVSGPLEKGRVLSLPDMKRWLDEILAPIQNTYLNDNLRLDSDTKREPTCENLCVYIYDHMYFAIDRMPEVAKRRVKVVWVQVAVLEQGGVELGSVRYYPSDNG